MDRRTVLGMVSTHAWSARLQHHFKTYRFAYWHTYSLIVLEAGLTLQIISQEHYIYASGIPERRAWRLYCSALLPWVSLIVSQLRLHGRQDTGQHVG